MPTSQWSQFCLGIRRPSHGRRVMKYVFETFFRLFSVVIVYSLTAVCCSSIFFSSFHRCSRRHDSPGRYFYSADFVLYVYRDDVFFYSIDLTPAWNRRPIGFRLFLR